MLGKIKDFFIARKYKHLVVENKKLEDKKKEELANIKQAKQEFKKIESAKKFIDITKKQSLFTRWMGILFEKNAVYVVMQLRNGDYDFFKTYVFNQVFNYEGKTYVVDTDKKCYIKRLKLYVFFYHQDISIPLSFNVDAEHTKGEIEKYQMDVDMMLNPETLKRFIESEFIQKVMRGADLGKDIGMIKMVVILNILIGVANFLLMMGLYNK